MNLLLDTHIFLWFISNDKKLSNEWRNLISIKQNNVYVSVISLWEVILKYQLGKINFPESPEIYIPKQRKRHQLKNINLDEQSVTELIKLPLLHRDPFDRMLMSQAIANKLIFITVDSKIREYSIQGLSLLET